MAWHATNGKTVDKAARLLLDPEDLRNLELAEELTRSCFEMYAQTATGLAAEIVFWKTRPSEPVEGPPFPQSLFDYHVKPIANPLLVEGSRKAVPCNGENDTQTRFGDRFSTHKIESDFTIHPQDGHNLLRYDLIFLIW